VGLPQLKKGNKNQIFWRPILQNSAIFLRIRGPILQFCCSEKNIIIVYNTVSSFQVPLVSKKKTIQMGSPPSSAMAAPFARR